MNVEQLIEDGKKQHKKTFEEMYWGDDCRASGEEGFALGVRHAIAAMFPVVRVEEVEIGKEYWCKPKVGGFARQEDAVWQVLRAVENHISDPRLSFTGNNWHRIHPTSLSEIRRCPTPSELGVG